MKSIWALVTAGLLSAATAGVLNARAEDSILDSLGRSAGLVAPDPDMPDFVKASRPKGDPAPLPAFAAPPEPKSKVKSAAELKAMDADLAKASARATGVAPTADGEPRAKKSARTRHGK